jgi:hypothetical protein
MTSIFLKMEDDLNFGEYGRRHLFLVNMEDALIFSLNQRRLQFFDNGRCPHLLKNERRPHFF